MNGFSRIGLAAVGSLVLASAAFAQGAPPTPEQRAAQQVKTRQAVFDLVSFTFGPAGASLRPGGAPLDPAAATKIAQRLQVLATFIPEVFIPDTHAITGLTTKARDAIWTNKSDFDQKASDFGAAAAALETAAKGGDAGEIKKAVQGVGKGCAGCHDNFRDK
jgi:cytochrome c556